MCQPGALLEAEVAATTATTGAAKIHGFELKVNKMCDTEHQAGEERIRRTSGSFYIQSTGMYEY